MENTNINLEKIVKEGTSLMLNEQANKEPDLTKKIPYWMNYATQEMGEKASRPAYEILRADPLAIGSLIANSKNRHQKQLVDEVKKDPQSVIKNLDQNYAINMAVPYLGDGDYKALSDAINNNGDVKGLFANLYDNDLWRYVVAKSFFICNITTQTINSISRVNYQAATF